MSCQREEGGRNEKVPSGVCNGEIITARRQLAVVSGRAQGRAAQAAWPGTSSPPPLSRPWEGEEINPPSPQINADRRAGP